MMITSILEAVEEQAGKENEIRHNQLLVKVMEERDESLLKILRKEKLEASSIKKVEKNLQVDRENRTTSANGAILLDADSQLSSRISHLRNTILPQAEKTSKEIINSVSSLMEKIARIEAELGRVPDEDRIAQAQVDLDLARKAHSEKTA